MITTDINISQDQNYDNPFPNEISIANDISLSMVKIGENVIIPPETSFDKQKNIIQFIDHLIYQKIESLRLNTQSFDEDKILDKFKYFILRTNITSKNFSLKIQFIVDGEMGRINI